MTRRRQELQSHASSFFVLCFSHYFLSGIIFCVVHNHDLQSHAKHQTDLQDQSNVLGRAAQKLEHDTVSRQGGQVTNPKVKTRTRVSAGRKKKKEERIVLTGIVISVVVNRSGSCNTYGGCDGPWPTATFRIPSAAQMPTGSDSSSHPTKKRRTDHAKINDRDST